MTQPPPPPTDVAYPAWQQKELLGWRRIMKVLELSKNRPFQAAQVKGYSYDAEQSIILDRICYAEHGVTPYRDWVDAMVTAGLDAQDTCFHAAVLEAGEMNGTLAGTYRAAICPHGENGVGLSMNERRDLRLIFTRMAMKCFGFARSLNKETA